MRNFKKLFMIGMIVILAFSATACGNESSYRDKQYSEELKQQISDTIGYPQLSHFFEYSQLKEIYELRDDPDLICYWYTMNEFSGKWVYQGKCIGYGIPYSASVTSPDTVYYNSSGAVVSQAEPNGIFTNGLSTSATWVLVADQSGNVKPRYVEQSIMVSQTKVDSWLCEEWSIPENY